MMWFKNYGHSELAQFYADLTEDEKQEVLNASWTIPVRVALWWSGLFLVQITVWLTGHMGGGIWYFFAFHVFMFVCFYITWTGVSSLKRLQRELNIEGNNVW